MGEGPSPKSRLSGHVKRLGREDDEDGCGLLNAAIASGMAHTSSEGQRAALPADWVRPLPPFAPMPTDDDLAMPSGSLDSDDLNTVQSNWRRQWSPQSDPGGKPYCFVEPDAVMKRAWKRGWEVVRTAPQRPQSAPLAGRHGALDRGLNSRAMAVQLDNLAREAEAQRGPRRGVAAAFPARKSQRPPSAGGSTSRGSTSTRSTAFDAVVPPSRPTSRPASSPGDRRRQSSTARQSLSVGGCPVSSEVGRKSPASPGVAAGEAEARTQAEKRVDGHGVKIAVHRNTAVLHFEGCKEKLVVQRFRPGWTTKR